MMRMPVHFGSRPGALRSILLLALAGCSTSEGRPAEDLQDPAGITAFVDATVIPMDSERVLPNHTVLIRDGRIIGIGPAGSIDVPEGARRIEASGKYLLPGLGELHAHIPTGDMGSVERTLFLYLAGGVTTIRGMQGNPLHLELRERTAAHDLLGPRIYTSGPTFTGGSASSPEAATRMAEEQHAAGFDLLKVQDGMSRASFDATIATAQRLRIPVAGHVPASVGLMGALRAGYASIDHLDAYIPALAGYPEGGAPGFPGLFGFNYIDQVDLSRLPPLIAATREAGVWNAPTQTLLEHLASTIEPEVMAAWPEMAYMPAQTIQQWVQYTRNFRGGAQYTPERGARIIEVRRQILSALHEAGAPIVLGSDAPQWWNVPGFSVRRELAFMVAAGLTPFEALLAGTRSAALAMDAEEEWGTITAGRSADLILLEASPLEDIGNLRMQSGVMIRGHWIPQSEIEERLAAIAAELREG